MLDQDYKDTTKQSAAWSRRAHQVLPNGITVDTRYFSPYGLYIAHASGVHKTDVDGNRLLDFFGGHGALVLGHGHPKVNAAINQALSHGIQYAANHPLEVRWAERIVRHIPTAERVRFAGSGTEATLLAMRIARAFTGRAKIVRIATHYHGWHDFASSGYNGQFDGAPATGVLKEIAENTILVSPNDVEGLQAIFKNWGTQIAAVIAEPLGSHFGLVPTEDEFLKELQAVARNHGSLFILDEVISAFRVSPGGMQSQIGLEPDLTTLGKAAAGGMPGGAVCGRAEVMDVLDFDSPKKFLHQGTFTGNPLTAAAAIATIDEIVENEVCPYINNLGEVLRLQLNNLFKRTGTPWHAYGRYSQVHLHPISTEEQGKVINPTKLPRFPAKTLAALRMGLILEGVDVGGRGSMFISSQHTLAHVDELTAAMERVLLRLKSEDLLKADNRRPD